MDTLVRLCMPPRCRTSAEVPLISSADTEKDPLILEIRTRMSPIPRASGSRASGAVYAGYSHHGVVSGADRSGGQCVVKVMCGNVCYVSTNDGPRSQRMMY